MLSILWISSKCSTQSTAQEFRCRKFTITLIKLFKNVIECIHMKKQAHRIPIQVVYARHFPWNLRYGNYATNEVELLIWNSADAARFQSDARWFATRLITKNNLKKRDGKMSDGGLGERNILDGGKEIAIHRNLSQVYSSAKVLLTVAYTSKAGGKNSRRFGDAFDINLLDLSTLSSSFESRSSLAAE